MSHLIPEPGADRQLNLRQSISFGAMPMKIDTRGSNESAKTMRGGEEGEEDAKPREGAGMVGGSRTTYPQSPFPWQPQGYALLAGTMAQEPSLAVFRRFGRLNALNLLALQAELQCLESEYQQQLRADDTSIDGDARRLSTDMNLLFSSQAPHARQRELLEQIRPRLDAYNSALAAVAAVEKLPRPHDGDVANLRGWLGSPDGGDGFMTRCGGPEACTYDEVWRDDFVSLAPDEPGQARVAKLLNPRLLRWYHRHVEWRLHPRSRRGFGREGVARKGSDDGEKGPSSRSWEEHREYLDRRDGLFGAISVITSVSATILASLLPVIAVLVLFFIQSVEVRIAATIGMTVAFGMLLALFTNSSLKEIFSATVAFAGLEVIFIGTNGVG